MKNRINILCLVALLAAGCLARSNKTSADYGQAGSPSPASRTNTVPIFPPVIVY